MNRTILEAVRAMLSDSKFPKTFWAGAVSTAVYVKNRSPTSAHKNLTPYQALNGHKPNVQHFRTFGCMAYAHVPKDGKEKLDSKSKTCVLLGYGSETKGYGLYDFNAKRVLLSRDVVFNESQFISFEKEPSKEIECVPCSFPQEEKHEDSEGELELRRSTRNRVAPDRFVEWVCFAQDKFDVPRAVAFYTKEIDLVCCPSNDMLADIFTKGLSVEKFSRLIRKLGVVFFAKHIQCEKEC
ncbi:Ribonuclease H-like domain [Trinorchestia longiramus]|nr:Ribonuclease H-like domain [Trinorchestia longiramus]